MASIPDQSVLSRGPRLSNFLSALAADVAGHVSAYRRSSLDAHRAYLAAGAKLVEARGECRRGEWGPFLQAAGVEGRTARNMMMLARAGLRAEDVTDRGGVQASIDALRQAAAGAVDAAAGAAEAGEKTESDSVFPPADPPPGPGREPGEIPDWRDGRPPAPPGHGITQAPSDGLSEAQRKRQAKRDRGECIDCSNPVDGFYVRCPACRERIAAADKRRRENAKLGAVLGKRIREAARHGRGVRLTAADVAGLVSGERARFAERLAAVGASKGRKRGDTGAGG